MSGPKIPHPPIDAGGDRTALYRFHDADGRLLYAGITNDPSARWSQHARLKASTWWPHVAETRADWISALEWFPSRESAAAAEIDVIKTEGPLHNISRTAAPLLVSASGGLRVTTEHQDWVTFSEIARRVVDLGYAQSMTRQAVTRIAYTDPSWPVPRDQWRYIAPMWAFPWKVIEPFFRNRVAKERRGPDQNKKRFPAKDLHALAREAFQGQPFSYADLHERLGIPIGTLSPYARRLVAAGAFKVVGKRKTEANRPHVLYIAVPNPSPGVADQADGLGKSRMTSDSLSHVSESTPDSSASP